MKPCRCGRCGARYEHAAFLALALVERLDGEAIAGHVVHWPDGTKIDVRACERCQTPIARLAHAATMETAHKGE